MRAGAGVEAVAAWLTWSPCQRGRRRGPAQVRAPGVSRAELAVPGRAHRILGGLRQRDVFKFLREAVDEIESRQLQAALERLEGREAMLSMLLPFADAEPVEVRWSHARQASSDGRRAPWVVELHTDSSRFGKVWMRTRISDGTQVDLVMWAEQAELAARARAGSASLAAWLGEAGLRMTGLQVIHGSRPALEADAPIGPGLGAGRLIDLQA